jgi:UDP:flavonoid glycosyltransferase YjiC (YdhE family)
VLPHTDLLVSHGGQATASAGLTNGVPLLLHPLSRDQDRVAAHIAGDGSGLVVGEQTSDPDLRESMRLLLREGRFRAVAAEHARVLQRLGNGRLAVEALERLAPAERSS